MKKLIGSDIGAYVFDPIAQTITFSGLPEFSLENVLVITNVTTGTMLYNFADPDLGGVLTDAVFVLDYDTTAMGAGDALQIWIDLPTIYPTHIEGQGIDQSFTYDTNLEKVFGSQPVIDGNQLLAKSSMRRFPRVVANLIGVNSEVRIPCEGANSVAIQLGGTWAGTQTFQGSIDGGYFYGVHTVPLGGGSQMGTTTGNGWWIINCSGMAFVRVVFTSYTSGVARVTLVADAAQPMNVSFPGNLATTNASLDVAIGAVALFQPALTEIQQQKVAPVVNPTQPATYAEPKFANWPQRYRRLRVQIGADQNLPLAQEENTNRLIVATPELYSKIEELLMQQTLTNQLLAQAFNLSLPKGMAQEII